MQDLTPLRTAFILGAGLGMRMRPLTEKVPKPLLPVGGRPLITYAMDHCLSIGIERFIVNTHHRAECYGAAFPDGRWRGRPVFFCHEPILLDTAGGLKNIEGLLEATDEAIVVYNGDILSDLPLSQLIAAHAAGGREATLALRSDGPLLNVSLDAGGEICDFRDLLGNPGVRRCLFTGISVIARRFLRRLTPGKSESTIPVFAAMIAASPGAVAATVIDQGLWEDVGDIAAYRRIEAAIPRLCYEGDPFAGGRLDGVSSPRPTKPQGLQAGTADDTPVGRGGRHTKRASSGGVKRAEPLSLEEFRGSPLPAGPEPLSTEAGAAESVWIGRTLGLAAGTRITLAPVGKGGSDRSYFRIAAHGGPPAVLMRYGRLYPENDRYATVAAFLAGIGVRVPAIYGHDRRRRLMLIEDLGDRDLYALREAPWEIRRGLYEKSLELAARIAAFPLDRLPGGLKLMPGFDASLYRWERNYFVEHCVGNVCRITLGKAEAGALEAELAALAARLLATPPVLVHRDLQSQNVMVREGEPVLIDFQGMRPGSPFYDPGSLLCDPYVRFPAGGRDELLGFHHRIAGARQPREAFRELFLLAAAQRLMQALGAYGFLGLVREKPHFLAHIGPALDNLVSVAAEAGSLPLLHALASRCRETTERAGLAGDGR